MDSRMDEAIETTQTESPNDAMTRLQEEAQNARNAAEEKEQRLAELKRQRAIELRQEAQDLEDAAAAKRTEADCYDPPDSTPDAEPSVNYEPEEPKVLQQARERGDHLVTPRKKTAKNRTAKRGPGRPKKSAKKPFKKAAKRGRPPKNGARKAGKQLAGPSSEKPTPEQILKLLTANPATPGVHIAATGGWKPTDTMAVLKTLEADGRVAREGEKRGTKWSVA